MTSTRKALLTATGVCVLLASVGAGVLVRHGAETTVPTASGATGSDLGSPLAAREAPLVASLAEEPNIPESDFFYRLMELVKREYVDPVKDEDKLAVGSVRGMVGSLADPLATFMGPEQFSAFTNTQRGLFAGVGIETQFRYDEAVLERIRKKELVRDPAELVPQLLITAVAPAGPADRAGLRAGDRVDSVNGRWVLSAEKIATFREESRAIRESKREAAEIDRLLREMQTRARDGLTPARARDLLTVGETGTLKLTVSRGSDRKTVDLTKQRTTWPAVVAQPDGTLRVAIFAQTPTELRKALAGKTAVRLDLRNQPLGNFEALKPVLAELAPAGVYGGVANERGRPVQPFAITTGTTEARKITLLVDESTRGAGEILALALSSRGKATLSGKATRADRDLIAVHALPDGSGYTLPIGRYQVEAPKTPPRPASATRPAARPATPGQESPK